MIFNPPKGVGVGDTVAIPLGFIAGYAIAGEKGKGPMLDIDPFFLWPGLFTPGIKGNAVTTADYAFGVEATYYFYL